MGLTKEYSRYVPAGNFNVIASSNCNVCFVSLEGQEGRYVATGACEHAVIWDMRLCEKAQVLSGEDAQVSCLRPSPDNKNLACGYSDGSVQIFDLKSGDVAEIFSGHRSEVTCLSYDSFGHKLASGSKDTDVIVWDTVSEAGVCRLSGHRGPITCTAFLREVLITASKDSHVKLWDLETQHCFQTLTGHRSEVWSLALLKDNKYLVTGCGDTELRVWQLLKNDEDMVTTDKFDDEQEGPAPLRCRKTGSVLRRGRGRVVSMDADSSGRILCCTGTDKQVEVFEFCSDDETAKRHKKRLKKNPTISRETTLQDEVRRLTSVELKEICRYASAIRGGDGEIRVCVSTSNNSLELHRIRDSETSQLSRIGDKHGHGGDARTVCFSSDGLAVLSAGAGSIKLWNRPSQTCLRTINIEKGRVLCLCFAPGDRHALAGLQDGRLLIIDVAAGDILEEICAHSSAELWSITSRRPSPIGCVTAGADKTVKFWTYELVSVEGSKSRELSLLHRRTLKLEEPVLSALMTTDGRLIAAALLDCTVRLFFDDTLKPFATLYGHGLPVLCMDVSHDSMLLATGSADRTVKIWGLDHADCRKTLLAHEGSVTGVNFIARTRELVSCGRDGTVRHWDGEKGERVAVLRPGHAGDAWALTISPSDGKYVVSCGSDRSLRCFGRSDDRTLVLEDEREQERELEEQRRRQQEEMPTPGAITRPTADSDAAADALIECLEACEQITVAHIVPPLARARGITSSEELLLDTLRRIRMCHLEQALLLLPEGAAKQLALALHPLLLKSDSVEVAARTLVFLLQSRPVLAPLTDLTALRDAARPTLTGLRDLIGYNKYAMLFLQRQVEATQGIRLFRDATFATKKKNRKRKILSKSVIV